MKRKLCIAACVIVCILVLILLFPYILMSFYHFDSVQVDGLMIHISRGQQTCIAGRYLCEEYTPNLEIVIPDTYNGFPVVALGGTTHIQGPPSPFYVDIGSIYINAPKNSEYDAVYIGDESDFEDHEVIHLPFRLYIGKNIRDLSFVHSGMYYPHINEDESITYYHPVVYITCAEENRHYYSIDGKLYSRSTNQLITDFDYAE